jgi:hypothetical protein
MQFCCCAFGRNWHKADIPRLTAICLLSEQSGHGLSEGAASTPFCDSTVRVI